jgi:hypothetical protein
MESQNKQNKWRKMFTDGLEEDFEAIERNVKRTSIQNREECIILLFSIENKDGKL